MDGHQPVPGDYFTARDYKKKWENFSRKEDDPRWKSSQLTDTAYAAVAVQSYLQSALWPDEKPHVEKESERRIIVTKGAYTAKLRREWRLYATGLWEQENSPSPEDDRQRSLKNRGDHREHAVDAVAIAAVSESLLQSLAKLENDYDAQWRQVRRQDGNPINKKRPILPPPKPWVSIEQFREDVLSKIYPEFENKKSRDESQSLRQPPLVVCHRASGRKLSGALHEESLFSPVAGNDTLFTAAKDVASLTPKHLREQVSESDSVAIDRFAASFLKEGTAKTPQEAKKKAKALVLSKGYVARMVDPSPEKTGLVKDLGIRRCLRKIINERLLMLQIDANCDSFTPKHLERILKETGPLTMPSGVPILRVKLLRTMNDPVRIPRKRWNEESNRWELDSNSRSTRIYVGGSNHHIEIRENAKGNWIGQIVGTYEAAKRAKVDRRDPVNRKDDDKLGGQFVMSLSEGETIFMRDPRGSNDDYFVVFKLEKPSTIYLKRHTDARRAMGEKDANGQIDPTTKREEFPVSSNNLKDLAPHGYSSPVKVAVDPLGIALPIISHRKTKAEPFHPEILAIVREAIEARSVRTSSAKIDRQKARLWLVGMDARTDSEGRS